MEGIRRFDHVSFGMVSDSNGEYVTYYECEKVVASVATRAMEQIDSIKAIHEAEVARLRAELQNAAKAALDAVALSCEKEREADALRTEVEGLRTTLEVIAVGDSRTPHIDAAQALLRSGYWIDEIDAAMGASA